MDFRKHALILAAINSLRAQGSWTGKTHVNKALSLLRDVGKADVPFGFVLYKHGPYSFDVEDELEQMQSYGAISIEPNASGYGVRLSPGEKAEFVQAAAPLSAEDIQAIEEVSQFVGARGVSELEQLATASWIRAQEGKTDSSEVANRLNALKPHISLSNAEKADSVVSAWLTAARSSSCASI